MGGFCFIRNKKLLKNWEFEYPILFRWASELALDFECFQRNGVDPDEIRPVTLDIGLTSKNRSWDTWAREKSMDY